MSVCVCLVGFASLQSTWAHTLRHPCLACSSRCTEYCHSHNNCKKTIIPQKSPSPLPPLSKVRCCRPKKFGRLPEGLLAPPRFAPHSYRPLSKVRCCRRKNSGDYRRDCHTNPRPAPHSYRPLSKVRCCRRKNSGDYRRDCHTNPRPAPTLPKTALSLSLFVG